MTTKRESIIQHVVTVLGTVSAVTGVHRSREDALSREEAPALVVRGVREDVRRLVHAYVEKDLTISVSVYTRGSAPDQGADPICEQVYALLMADPTLGGLAIDTSDDGTSWEGEEADSTAGWAELQLKVWYRHPLASLAQPPVFTIPNGAIGLGGGALVLEGAGFLVLRP